MKLMIRKLSERGMLGSTITREEITLVNILIYLFMLITPAKYSDVIPIMLGKYVLCCVYFVV